MSLLARALLLFVATLLIGTVAADQITDATDISLGTAITIFAAAFGAWAVVLGWVMLVVRREFAELREFVREESDRRRLADERAHQDRLHLERRLTEIETYWRAQHGAG